MKIILSPAKEMNTDQAIQKDWTLSKKSIQVVEALEALSREDFQKTLKISDKQLESQLAYRQAFNQPVSYRALEMYNGLAFRQISDTTAYLKDHLRILSALYGVVSPDDLLKPYRLDFAMPLEVNNQSLKDFWKGTWDQAFDEGETVLNLASQEFASLLYRSRYKWVDIDFYELGEKGQAKRSSAQVKKARGLMVQHLSEVQGQDLDDLKSFQAGGYEFMEEESGTQQLVFRKVAR